MRNQYLKQLKVGFVIPAFLVAVNIAKAQAPVMLPPPQDKGLPYTKSAKPLAVAKIKDYIAVFPGSRYAWVQGYKIRLDDVNWHLETINKNGVLYVPVAFAGVLSLKQIKTDVAPAYLAEKWVYTITRPDAVIGAARTVDIDGKKYVSFTDVAKANGLKIFEDASGLTIAGNNLFNFSNNEHLTLLDIITQFDSPEKLADPDIATEYIPALKRQGKWTDHVKVTPEQMKILNGPETKWEMTPKSAYDYSGFNTRLLGSKVPPPGVYPRILFSEQDIPMLAERLKSSKSGQKSLIEIKYLLEKSFWDPNSSDGKVFAKLASGNLVGLEWADVAPGSPITNIPQLFKEEKPGIYNSHVAYVPECLTNMALYCLLTNDNVHGRQAAAAIANYFKLREPLIDEWNSVSDSEFGTSYTRPDGTLSIVGGNGANTAWRNIHGLVAHMNLGLSLDFAGKWMTAEEKDLMRRVISKATYGRRGYGQDGSIRFRDINWVAWDLPNFLALTAIEGLEGFDKEAYESNCETVKAFAEWGIDPNGVIYESNGKTPGGMQFFTLSMIALARRGDNVWGHPHVRKLLQGQIQMTSPDGKVIVNSGTQYVPFSRSNFSFETIEEFKAFYPENKAADYLLSQAKNFADLDENNHEWLFDDFDAKTYAKQLPKRPRLRLPSPTYPGFVHGFLYNNDFESTSRSQLNLPLTFNAPVHGVFSGYSDTSPNATWIDMMVRPDHYLGAGHHHADAGMIHFSAMGVDWFTESPFPQSYDGKYHNQVLVDGVSEPESASNLGTGYQAAATYIGENGTDAGAFATADLTNSYSYRWQTQPGQVWEDKLNKLNWELDPSEQNMKTFAGTAHYKMRPWWATYTYSNYIATSRAPFNPMQYVYRSVGLIRGTHPFAVVVDNLKKDDKTHLYQWTAMLNGGVYQADIKGLAPGQAVLAIRPYDAKFTGTKSLIKPQQGEPLLLVCAIAPDSEGNGPVPDIKISTELGPPNSHIAVTQNYDRIAINITAKDVAYRIILIPFHYGDDLPVVNMTAGKASIAWKEQSDTILFEKDAEKRDHIKVESGGKLICESK